MIEILKKIYESAYELPSFYLGIENETYCHIFTSFFILALLLSLILIIKMAIGTKKERRDRRERKRKMEKNILKVLEERDKNKKNL